MRELIDAITAVAGKQDATSRLGVVTAIDENTKSLTVDINPGDPATPVLLHGIRWFDTYYPEVDDLVGLIAIGSGWWVLGRNSYDMRQTPRAYGEVTVNAGRVWKCEAVERDSIYWWEQVPADDFSRVGVSEFDPSMPSTWRQFYTAVELPRPSDIPSGATIESGYLTIYAGDGGGWDRFTHVVTGAHGYTSLPSGPPSSWGDDVVEMYVDAQPRYHQVYIGSDVALGLVAGTAKGVMLSPTGQLAMASIGGVQATITYSVPI